jgi:hypothetical protein
MLEKMLLEHRKAYLHGHAWIGKSSFLQYARKIWEQTSFADEVIYFDFASSPVHDLQSFMVELLSQHPRVSSEMTGKDVDAFLWHAQNNIKALFIFDGLHAAFTAFGSSFVLTRLENVAALGLKHSSSGSAMLAPQGRADQ